MPNEKSPKKRDKPAARAAPLTEQEERIVRISLSDLHPFKGYPGLRDIMPRRQPYQVRDDDPIMQQIAATVKVRGVRQPGLVRPDPEGGYEIIAGHRRYRASELAELTDMPVIVRNMTDEEAVTELVDSNIQREDVLPSERAWAYRLRLEVAKHQGARTDLTSPQIAAKLRSDDEIGKSLGISGDTLRRHANLTNLVPPLMKLVDEGEIGLSTAYPLSALSHDEQRMVLDGMDYSQNIPSLSQAQRLKKLSQQKSLTVEQTRVILSRNVLYSDGTMVDGEGKGYILDGTPGVDAYYTGYFFAKTLDQVRPGGIIAFVTSHYTMDKRSPEVRRYIAQRADLLGAIRLPNNAFKANANTEVTSDILFLQKRDRPLDIVPDWVHLGETADGIPINYYFASHPEMVLGTMQYDDRMYGDKTDVTCLPIPGADLSAQLHEAVQHIRGEYIEAELPELGEGEKIEASIPADPNVQNYSYTVVDGEVYFRENSVMVRRELNATAKERIKGMVELRDCTHRLIDLQMWESDPLDIRAEQQRLNQLYDSFTAKFGLINSNANSLAFSDDSAYYLLCSLEVIDEDGNLKRKADMFTKRTIKQAQVVTSVDTASEALAVSIAEKARVDIPYMMQLSGKTEEELASELQGVIYRDFGDLEPDHIPKAFFDITKFPYVTADEYLSGDVRRKLKLAEYIAGFLPEEQAKTIQPNIEALRAVQPKDLEASEIDVRLGAAWIGKEYIQQFMEELLEPPYYLRHILKVNYADFTAEWNIAGKGRVSSTDVAACTAYGTQRANAYEILEDTLNLRDVRIYDTVEDISGHKRRVLNSKETTLAQQKQQAIKDAFRDWIWRDPDRRQHLVRKYNDIYNSVRPREYDGQHITFSGINPEITLRPHQLRQHPRRYAGAVTGSRGTARKSA